MAVGPGGLQEWRFVAAEAEPVQAIEDGIDGRLC
jgi:hypothetical protein